MTQSADLDTSIPPVTENTMSHFSGKPDEMTMLEHLNELRQRIIVSVVSVLVAIFLAFFFSVPAINALKLLAPVETHFVQLTPGEAFMATFRVSVFLGIALASPVVLYQVMRFVLPGLSGREKKFLLGIVMSGTVLFVLGAGFAYWAVIPPALEWLLDFGKEIAERQMSIARFSEFCTSLILLTGILFELPMVLFMLSLTGLVTAGQLLRQWRMATVIIFLVAALATPSQDPFSMILVAVAMMVLYWVSILSIQLFGRKPKSINQ